MTWVLILVFLAIWVPDLPGLVRGRHWPELAAFAVLWVLGLTLALLVSYSVPVDHVTQFLRGVFEPIGQRLVVAPPD
ncbi:MAG TPA: hypothetical protein VIK93_07425 [Limnochordales bacterium]